MDGHGGGRNRWAELYYRLKAEGANGSAGSGSWDELRAVATKLLYKIKKKLLPGFYIPQADFEDIVAHTVAAVWRYVKADAVRSPNAFGAIIARIITNELLEYVKRQSRMILQDPATMDTRQHQRPHQRPPKDVMSILEEAERSECLHRAIAEIDEEQKPYLREYLAIRYKYGYSPFKTLTEAAEAYGMSITKFWRMCRRAFGAFAELLKRCLEGEER